MEKRKELRKKTNNGRGNGTYSREGKGEGGKGKKSGRKNTRREGRTRNWLEIERRKDNDNGDKKEV